MAQLESGKPHSLKEIFCGENGRVWAKNRIGL